MWRRLKTNPLSLLGLGLITSFALLAVLAPLIAPMGAAFGVDPV
ncbi:MAG: D,D-dipeptide ABC transporter permease, partial [Elusimicrobiota bacterium]